MKIFQIFFKLHTETLFVRLKMSHNFYKSSKSNFEIYIFKKIYCKFVTLFCKEYVQQQINRKYEKEKKIKLHLCHINIETKPPNCCGTVGIFSLACLLLFIWK